MYYVLLPSLAERTAVIARMRARGVRAGLPLRAAAFVAGGPALRPRHGSMALTDDLSARLLRLPLWIGVDADAVMGCFIEACTAVCGDGS